MLPFPAPWEYACMCKLSLCARCTLPHCVPGSNLWWVRHKWSVSTMDLEQHEGNGVTTKPFSATIAAVSTMSLQYYECYTEAKEEESSQRVIKRTSDCFISGYTRFTSQSNNMQARMKRGLKFTLAVMLKEYLCDTMMD